MTPDPVPDRLALLESVVADVEAWLTAPMILSDEPPVPLPGGYWPVPNFDPLREILQRAKETE